MLETEIDVGKTALLVIDMQNDLIKVQVGPGLELTLMAQKKGIIGSTARVIAAARRVGMPVIYSNHVHRADNADTVPTITDQMLQGISEDWSGTLIEGTPGAGVVAELAPVKGDHVINKRKGSAFYATDLELMLRAMGKDTVIMAGVVTNGCIAATVQGARERDFNVIIVSDGCAASLAEDDKHYLTRVFPYSGRVRTSDEVVAAITRADD